MSTTTERRALDDLARSYGVQPVYRSVLTERPVRAPVDSVLAVLRCMGVPIASARDVPDALRARRAALAHRVIEPVVVAWDGLADSLTLRTEDRQRRARLTLRLEDGSARRWTLDLRRRAPELALPGPLPFGRHRLDIEIGRRVHRTHVIAAPRRAWKAPDRARGWGVFLPLYAVRAPRTRACGSLADLEALLSWTAQGGGSVVATLPMLAAFLDIPFDPSPYSPASRLFWNELYLDPERTPEFAACREVRALYASGSFLREREALARAPRVDYRRAAALQRRVLEPLARSFFRETGGNDPGLRRYLRDHPDLDDYARFRATVERWRAGWPAWPSRLRDGSLRDGDFDEDAHRFHVWAQWRFDGQIASLAGRARAAGTGLYLDLPLGCHPDGWDVWRHRSLFALEASGGAPPDHFTHEGQSWGFPPLHPDRIRDDGYGYWAACLRHLFRHADVLRIDHVMSLHRLYWVPNGLPASRGVYVRYRPEETYAVLTLESWRASALAVGEDLGTVPREVRPAMARHGILRTWALQRALSADPRRALDGIPDACFASFNTHDHPPFAGFWRGLDIEDRAGLGLLDAAGVRRERTRRERARRGLVAQLERRGFRARAPHREDAVYLAALDALGTSRARMVLVNLEDLWGETRPQNVPTTVDERPNWRRRARVDLDVMMRSRRIVGALRALDRSRRSEDAP